MSFAMLTLWLHLFEQNQFLPASQITIKPQVENEKALEEILEQLTWRLAQDLPGPLPQNVFDAHSAKAMAKVVYFALGNLHPDSKWEQCLLKSMKEVPAPTSAKEHITQAALGWFAVPIAKRMSSKAFQAINRADKTASTQNQIAEKFTGFLSFRPLLSLQEDIEEFFIGFGAPFHVGIEECLGLRRFFVQKLAMPWKSEEVLEKRIALIRDISVTWAKPWQTLRELLYLWAQQLGKEPILDSLEKRWLCEFLPLLQEKKWPRDLPWGIYQEAVNLRKSLNEKEEPFDGADI